MTGRGETCRIGGGRQESVCRGQDSGTVAGEEEGVGHVVGVVVGGQERVTGGEEGATGSGVGGRGGGGEAC